MYFINIKGLKEDIVEKRFEEKDRFIYILLYVGLYALLFEIITSFPSEELITSYDYAYSIMSVLITFFGTYFIYKANGANDGEDFAGKYFSIVWVISWRVMLITTPIIILLTIYSIYQDLPFVFDEIVFFIWGVGVEFLIYFLSYKAVLEIRKQE